MNNNTSDRKNSQVPWFYIGTVVQKEWCSSSHLAWNLTSQGWVNHRKSSRIEVWFIGVGESEICFYCWFFFISNKLWELKSIYKTKVRNSKKPCFLGCTWHFKVLGPGKFKTINWFWKVPLLWMASSWKYQWNTCTKVCGFLACFFAKMVPFVDLD